MDLPRDLEGPKVAGSLAYCFLLVSLVDTVAEQPLASHCHSWCSFLLFSPLFPQSTLLILRAP